MKNKHFVFFLFFFIVSSSFVNAAVGSWQTHLAYTDVKVVTQSTNKVFGLSSGALFSIDKRDFSIETYSKVTGLNDNAISLIQYSENDDALLIIYKNANIDIITPNGIYNSPDLEKKTMTGSKTINNISFKDGFAYLASDFGILKVNIQKREFSDTYIIGENASNVIVNGVCFWNDSIYASSATKLYSANTSTNLSNYENWKATIDIPDPAVDNKSIISFDNRLFLLKADGKLYVKDQQQTNTWTLFLSDEILSTNISQGRLNLTASQKIYSYSDASTSINTTTTFLCSMSVYDLNYKQFFVAAMSKGLAKVDEQNSSVAYYMPDGPALNDPFVMKFVGEKLYVTTTGTWASGNGTEHVPGAVMIYNGNSWFNVTEADIPVDKRPFTDVLNIAVDPNDPAHYYVGTFLRGGVYEFRNNAFYQRYNSDNTGGIIQNPFNNDFNLIIDGLTFDKDHNLWMTQSFSSDALKVMKNDGTWKSFYFSSFSSKYTVRDILIDQNNFKWVNAPRAGSGILVFDDNGTIDYTGDDRSKFMSTFYDQDAHSFTSDSYRCMVEDKSVSKKIWIGTANGPIIISDPSNVFGSDFSCTRIKIPRNDGTNLADYLLENESINAIAVDGANRKWLATKSSGVYLVSENGTETVYHFTTENSPLLSDNVLSVAINSTTGEVFFGTDQGIISYKGDATEGRTSFGHVYAYPNPVRETFEGVISIVGLVANSSVKITDVSGNLVYETMSNGGMATWDGKNTSGQRVSTGVYLALCSNTEGTESTVVKILIINK